MSQTQVRAFFDAATNTASYVVSDPDTRRAAVIDPVLDFNLASARTATRSAELIIAYVEEHDLGVDWILETHVHADHLSSSQYLQDNLGGQIAIGSGVRSVQDSFRNIFELGELDAACGQFDVLFNDNDAFQIGSIAARVLATPGHTPACVTYLIGDAAFVGDTLFMPDFGTARTDFPGGSAIELYASIQKILELPENTRLFMCHDYKAPGREEFAWETSVLQQREKNIHINTSVSSAAFVEMREGRDRQLGMPALIIPALQVNLRAGRLPEAHENGIQYLNIPVDVL
jgi:glyoxylase-like metal-dependent hydrolase (beta-lactamase superfamily II)